MIAICTQPPYDAPAGRVQVNTRLAARFQHLYNYWLRNAVRAPAETTHHA